MAGQSPPPRDRLRPPWSIVEEDGSFIVKDADGQSIACVDFDADASRRTQMKCLTKDLARRVAVNIARLPELITIEKRAKSGEGDEPAATE